MAEAVAAEPDTEEKPETEGDAIQELDAVDDDEKKYEQNEEMDDSSLAVDLLSIPLSRGDIKKYVDSKESPLRKRFMAQAPDLIANDASGCHDILRAELLGLKLAGHNGTYPVLNHFVDALNRCRVNKWLLSGKTKASEIRGPEHFFSTYCLHPKFKEFYENSKNKKSDSNINCIQTAVSSYNGRLLPPFKGYPFSHRIDCSADDGAKVAEYLFDIAQGISSILTPLPSVGPRLGIEEQPIIIPLQLDLLVINEKFKGQPISSGDDEFGSGTDEEDEEDDDTDDEDEDDEDSDNELEDQSPTDLGDLRELFAQKSIHFVFDQRGHRGLKGFNKNAQRVIGDDDCQRAVLVLDRRQRYGQNVVDPLFSFRPAAPYGSFERIDNLSTPSLHQNVFKSVLPRKGQEPPYGVKDKLGGQMLVFSFHVMDAETVRCYMFYDGLCLRFYPNDVFNVLPELFADPDGVRKNLRTKLKSEDTVWRRRFEAFKRTLDDKSFDRFYRGLVGESPRIEILE